MEAETLEPPAETRAPLEIRGETVTVRELSTGDMIKIGAIWARVVGRLGFDAPPKQLLIDGGDELLQITAIATGRPLPWLEALRIGECWQIADAVLAANIDYFMYLMPQLLLLLTGDPAPQAAPAAAPVEVSAEPQPPA